MDSAPRLPRGIFCLGKKAGISLDGPIIFADSYSKELQKLVKSEGLTAKADPPEGMTTINFKGFPEVDVWEAQMIAFREAVKTDAVSPLPSEGVLPHERDYGWYFPLT